jgi:soluble lytic murein transglycosylase-like protein
MRDITLERSTVTAPASLTRHALGLGVLVLVLGAAYAAARMDVADSVEQAAEHAVEVVAEEPAPRQLDINAHINEVAARHGVAPKLVAAIVAVESGFDSRAVSRRGAEGLMQLMPRTAAGLDVQDSFDPRDNIEGGVRHLKRLMVRFRNDVPLVLAAYNAGEQAVIAHRGIPPYRETRQYVVRVLRRYDREAARAVAQQLAGPPRPASPPARVAVTLVERVVALPLAPAASAEPVVSVLPGPVPSGPKMSESP